MLRSNLLKREGPCFSRRRSRSTQVDSDCKPLTPSGGCALNSDSVVPRAGDREDVVVTNDEEDVPVSTLVTPVTQPVSFVPTWADSPKVPRPRVLQPVCPSPIPGATAPGSPQATWTRLCPLLLILRRVSRNVK